MIASRSLVPFEVAAVLALAIGWPYLEISDVVPYAFPLLLAAALSRHLRALGWTDLMKGDASIGAIVGAGALVLAIVIGTPLVEHVTDRAVEWAQYGFVRGSATQVIVFAIYVGIAAFCAELALRGWIVDRVLELSNQRVLAIFAGAIAEALLTPGGVNVRIGAAIFGIGLGWIYVAGNRNITAPIVARVVFSVGALLLDGFKVIG